MSAEKFISQVVASSVEALYGAVDSAQLQIQKTRKEFEGDYTLVVFPLLKISKTTPENTGNAIGEWLKENTAEVFAAVLGYVYPTMTSDEFAKVVIKVYAYGPNKTYAFSFSVTGTGVFEYIADSITEL